MRSKPATIRKITPDPIYHDVVISKLINRIMKDGKRAVAQKQIYQTLDLLKEKTGNDPLETLLAALENIKPQMEVRARRIGGAAYQVPSPVRTQRKESLAIRWLILAARSRPSSEFHTFSEKLAAELIDALNNAGGAIKKKLDTHRMAEANKAFAHFRW
ncbi:MAG: 30S ribosomal protein S7 [Candidatus Amesbacteria bacterium GW2011_GWA2_42_12]|uniref:Small ribosomal subunit protein uS7 n=1 Tax=Candidatus Amesbacteria bacterium GW2011_GWA2_42_12 TaxID=1618356 RepID=A0A0G1ADH0_9BACT|nr:MAG: 30S ribosomal protein S7 [Candidatus Amesbacteria bacterium GW2011_GWA2_42_12]